MLIWRIGTYESVNTVKKIPGNYSDYEAWSLDTCDYQSNRRTATLGIVASSNRVIQCEELQIGLGPKKKTYSQFAMLIVKPQYEGVS